MSKTCSPLYLICLCKWDFTAANWWKKMWMLNFYILWPEPTVSNQYKKMLDKLILICLLPIAILVEGEHEIFN